jgi:hypothetical protein
MAEAEVIQLPTKATKFALLHQLTYPEAVNSKIAVCDMRGYLVGGPDRKGAQALPATALWETWNKDLAVAASREGAVPDRVAEYSVLLSGLTRPPKAGEPLFDDHHAGCKACADHIGTSAKECNTRRGVGELNKTGVAPAFAAVVEAAHPGLDLGMDFALGDSAPVLPPAAGRGKLLNPPRFTCSYSQIQSFLTCPRKWAAEKYFKTLQWTESEAQRQGNVAHKILEDYLKGKPLTPPQQELLAPWKKYPDLMLTAVDAGAELMVEHEICFKKDQSLCGWWDNNVVWFRSKSDVFLIKDRVLRYFDWKHGRTKPDTMQIRFAIACADLAFGDKWDTAMGKLIFLKEKDPQLAVQGLDQPITKADIPGIWAELFGITNRMESAWQAETFRMQNSGLCRQYCGDKTCPHCG